MDGDTSPEEYVGSAHHRFQARVGGEAGDSGRRSIGSGQRGGNRRGQPAGQQGEEGGKEQRARERHGKRNDEGDKKRQEGNGAQEQTYSPSPLSVR